MTKCWWPGGRHTRRTSEACSRFVVQRFRNRTANGRCAPPAASRRDGAGRKRTLFHRDHRKVMAVSVTASSSTFEAATPTALFTTSIAPGVTPFKYPVSSDGRFLINQEVEKSTASPNKLRILAARVFQPRQQIKDSCRARISAAAKSWVELNPRTMFGYGVSTLARKHRALNGVELCGGGQRASSVSAR